MQGKTVVMTEGVPWRELLHFSIPILLGSLFRQFYAMVDTWMVVFLYHRMPKR